MRKASSPCSSQGAIVFISPSAIAGLLPDDANARARAITWMFAAVNTVEPPILELVRRWDEARIGSSTVLTAR